MRVFKYRGGEFDRDLDSLSSNSFWAPSREYLNDPCEGLFTKENLDVQLETIYTLFAAKNENTNSSFIELKKSLGGVFEFVDKSGIYSLSKTPLEELLWAHYGASHTGFCIEYDLDGLIEYEKNDYNVVEVQYMKSPQSINISDINNRTENRVLKKMLGVKSKVWRYESEIRVVTSKSGGHEYNFKALKAVYFGLKMPNEQKLQLMDSLKGRGIHYYQIELKNNSYKFSFKSVEDDFANAPRYKYSIAPIAEYAITPDYVNKKYEGYIDYLYKASEIVRREPDCNKVEMAEFSYSKSTVKNPVVFVQYERKENRIVNHYLTIKDIDEKFVKITDL